MARKKSVSPVETKIELENTPLPESKGKRGKREKRDSEDISAVQSNDVVKSSESERNRISTDFKKTPPVSIPSLDFTHSIAEQEEFLQTEVYDEVDYAANLVLQETQAKVAEIQAKLAPESHPDFDGKHCIDCWAKIPKERLANGRIRCTICQEVLEKRNRMFNRGSN